jgi:PAS domain S-box-containing protein
MDQDLERSLLENLPGLGMILDGEGRILYVASSCREHLGMSPEALEGRPLNGLLSEGDHKTLAEVLSAGVRWKGEARFLAGKGELLHHQLTLTPIWEGKGWLLISCDVTGCREELEEASLELSRYEAYREIFDAANDAIFVHDIQSGAILHVNRKFEEMYGYTREEALDLTVEDLSSGEPPYDQEHAVELVRRAAAGQPQLFEWRARRKDGSLFWVEVNLKRAKVAGEERVLAVVRDVEERKRAEEELRRSEERYRAVFETSGTAIILVDERGTILEANPIVGELFGYSRDELVGKRRYMDFIMGEDLPRVKEISRKLAAGELSCPQRYEARGLARDGSVKHLVCFANSLPGVGGVASFIDVTDMKRMEEVVRESEARYRTIFESTGTAMYLVRRDGLITDINTEAERLFGYPRAEVVGRMRYLDLLHPDEVERAKDYSLRILRNELPTPFRYEAKVRHRSGRTLEAMVTVSMLPGREESVLSVVDITEKKEYERELRRRAQELKDFVSMAAHELRHPATLLKGYSYTLKRAWERMDREAREGALESIDAATDSLVELVEELLDASRVERGKLSLEPGPVNLVELLERAREELGARAFSREIVLDVEEDPGQVRADFNHLLRVLVILLDNAVKYSPPGEEITVTLSRRGGEALVSVLDRGPGIPEEDRERVFDRFYQSGNGKKGLGLGLYIARGIVEAHRGRIWCEPREGGGTAFRFTLPLGDTEDGGRPTD